jgi:hypothetical protein
MKGEDRGYFRRQPNVLSGIHLFHRQRHLAKNSGSCVTNDDRLRALYGGVGMTVGHVLHIHNSQIVTEVARLPTGDGIEWSVSCTVKTASQSIIKMVIKQK